MILYPQWIIVGISLFTAPWLCADLFFYDPFDSPADWGPPEPWVSDEPPKDHASVSEGSLDYPGLSQSQGNRLLLGDAPADYNFDFSDINLDVGETLYVSLLTRVEVVNEFGDISPMVRLYDRNDKHGSGISIGHGSKDLSSGMMGFSLSNRQRGFASADAKRTAEDLPIDATYLIVGAYTRGGGQHDGQVTLWVNPRQLGRDTPPEPTLTMDTYQSDAVWNRLAIRANGSSSHPEQWSIDEVRIGKSWAAVTPTGDTAWIPEPKAYAFALGVAVALLAWRRRR